VLEPEDELRIAARRLPTDRRGPLGARRRDGLDLGEPLLPRLRLAALLARVILADVGLEALDLLLLADKSLLLPRPAPRPLGDVIGIVAWVLLQPPVLEFQRPGGDGVEQEPVMADQHHGPGELREKGLQPLLAVEVEVVRRLVEQEQIGGREENPRQRGPGTLPTAHRGERLVELLF